MKINTFLVFIIIYFNYGSSFADFKMINEFLASNSQNLKDEYGEYDDWIEIRNVGDQPFDLGGYFITDVLSNPRKWQIPDNTPEYTTIPAGGYLILWADAQPDQGVLHLGFKLSKSGEQIGLWQPIGNYWIDSLSFGQQRVDISCGRLEPGNADLHYFTLPTPGVANTSEGYKGVTPVPQIWPDGISFDQAVDIELQANNQKCKIYYTLNGDLPTFQSLLYNKSIPITETTVIRCFAHTEDELPSDIVTKTVFINNYYHLPIFSLIGSWSDFFSSSTGIYSNPEERGDFWEKAVHIQFVDHDTLQFQANAGLRIQGSSSRLAQKKSFSLSFRNQYGESRLKVPLFPLDTIQSYDKLIVRSGSDDDLLSKYGTLIRDPLSMELWRRMGWLSSRNRYVMLYINHDFWGVYSVFEDVNADFVQTHYQYDDIDLIRYRRDGWELTSGEDTEWLAFIGLFNNNASMDDSLYQIVKEQMDIENFIDLFALIHVTGYMNWHYGVSAFRSKQENSLWQWVIWDCDRSYFDTSWNGFEYYNVHWQYAILEKLLTNNDFKASYINRVCDLINSVFRPSSVTQIADSIADFIRPEIAKEERRWNVNQDTWAYNYSRLKQVISDRPPVVQQQFADYFHLSSPRKLHLNQPSGGGHFRLNSLDITEWPWQGEYFPDIPVILTAVPAAGYHFDGWSDEQMQGDASVELILDQDKTLSARFILNMDTSAAATSLRISELMYNSGDNLHCGDWVEIYNAGSDTASLADWVLKDEKDTHQYAFPQDLRMPPQSFWVISADSLQFSSCYDTVSQFSGPLGFGLGGSDAIRLYNPLGTLVDSVAYGRTSPWPDSADGQGYSLEKMDCDSAFSSSQNWAASYQLGGTPAGRRFKPSVNDVDDLAEDVPIHFHLAQNFPNPFNPSTMLSFDLPRSSDVRLEVFDTRGRNVRTLLSSFMTSGRHFKVWNACDDQGHQVPSGLYICRIQAGEHCAVRKMVLVR